MSTYIDKKYINLISPLLEKFKWKSDKLANCRCPICGDSSRSKIKARGYFYQKGNDYFYRCHNCGIGHNMYNFLEKISLPLCKEYALERYRAGENGNSNYKKPKEEQVYPFLGEVKFEALDCFTYLSDLSVDHKAFEFVKDRSIPQSCWGELGFTDDFGKYAKQFNSSYDLAKEERLIILVRDKDRNVIGAQGRTLSKTNRKSNPKYITLRRNEDTKLVFGIEKLDKQKTHYVVEGPIDSMFIENSIATLGSSKFIECVKDYPDAVYVLDNEPRNKQIVSIYQELIKTDIKIIIWPHTCKEKDINDIVQKRGEMYMNSILENCVFNGIRAQFMFNQWRKCHV
jgi:hypothetical protein